MNEAKYFSLKGNIYKRLNINLFIKISISHKALLFHLKEALLHKDLKVKTSHIYSNLSDNSGMWSA
ncbi:hypothetical protein B7L41_16850 [Acinetobacter baumannii]|nr:hypothetical protein B7L41_16850 [Acinetobacter baumannii]